MVNLKDTDRIGEISELLGDPVACLGALEKMDEMIRGLKRKLEAAISTRQVLANSVLSRVNPEDNVSGQKAGAFIIPEEEDIEAQTRKLTEIVREREGRMDETRY